MILRPLCAANAQGASAPTKDLSSLIQPQSSAGKIAPIEQKMIMLLLLLNMVTMLIKSLAKRYTHMHVAIASYIVSF